MLVENIEQNHQQFIIDALAMGCIWGLENSEGWAQSYSQKYPDTTVMPFWSQPEYAESHCQDEWQDYQVTPISLEEFLDDWLPGMHGDVILVGVNWNRELEGDDLEPLDLLAEFEQAVQ